MYMGVEPKIGGNTPQIIHLFIGFSIIFTIHFGVPLFLETPIWWSIQIPIDIPEMLHGLMSNPAWYCYTKRQWTRGSRGTCSRTNSQCNWYHFSCDMRPLTPCEYISLILECIHMYVYLEPKWPFFIGKGLVLRGWLSKIEVIGALGICRYLYIWDLIL